MNILVTGAAGFIGNHLAKNLAEEHNVYGLFRDKRPAAWDRAWTALQGNILDFPRMLEIIVNDEIDQVYHLASRAIVRNCRLDPLGCFNVNVQGTANILEACRQAENVKGILCMESDKSYGSGPTPYREDQALRPTGIYEASKACVSHLVRAYYHNYGLHAFSIRSANVYGPGDPNASRLVPNTINRLLRGKSPQITDGADRFLREFIYIDDFASYARALMAIGPWGDAVNVGTGETATVSGLVKMICDAMGKPFAPEGWSKPGTLTEIEEQSLDLLWLKHKLCDDWQDPIPLTEGLKRTIEWHKQLS